MDEKDDDLDHIDKHELLNSIFDLFDDDISDDDEEDDHYIKPLVVNVINKNSIIIDGKVYNRDSIISDPLIKLIAQLFISNRYDIKPVIKFYLECNDEGGEFGDRSDSEDEEPSYSIIDFEIRDQMISKVEDIIFIKDNIIDYDAEVILSVRYIRNILKMFGYVKVAKDMDKEIPECFDDKFESSIQSLLLSYKKRRKKRSLKKKKNRVKRLTLNFKKANRKRSIAMKKVWKSHGWKYKKAFRKLYSSSRGKKISEARAKMRSMS